MVKDDVPTIFISNKFVSFGRSSRLADGAFDFKFYGKLFKKSVTVHSVDVDRIVEPEIIDDKGPMDMKARIIFTDLRGNNYSKGIAPQLMAELDNLRGENLEIKKERNHWKRRCLDAKDDDKFKKEMVKFFKTKNQVLSAGQTAAEAGFYGNAPSFGRGLRSYYGMGGGGGGDAGGEEY